MLFWRCYKTYKKIVLKLCCETMTFNECKQKLQSISRKTNEWSSFQKTLFLAEVIFKRTQKFSLHRNNQLKTRIHMHWIACQEGNAPGKVYTHTKYLKLEVNQKSLSFIRGIPSKKDQSSNISGKNKNRFHFIILR